ncbi:MAG: ABC transporter permease [Rhizobiaceae bacterium]
MTARQPAFEGRRFPSLRLILSWAVLAVMLLLVLYPLGLSVVGAFVGVSPGDLLGADAHAVFRMLRNTAILVVLSAVVALVLAVILAWIDERTDARIPAIGQMMPLFPLMLPPVAGVIGWAILLDPNAGFVNVYLRQLLSTVGIELTRGPFNVYTFTSLILLTGLYIVPYIYLMISSALRRLDPSLDEAARVSGAGPLATLFKVTLPAISPALASALVLCTIAGLGLFSVPFIVASGARIDVLSVYVFRLLEHYPPRTALAFSLAFGMMLVVQLLLLGQRYMLNRGLHATVGGRGYRALRSEIGIWRRPAQLLTWTYVVVTVVLPLVALIVVSVQRFWTPIIDLGQLSFNNYYTALFVAGPTSRALVNSFGLGAATATITMLVVGALILFGYHRQTLEARVTDIVTAIPATIPHTVVGISFLIAFSLPPFRMQNSLLLILMAYIVMALPFAGRTAAAAASAIGKEIAEAAKVFGASDGRVFWKILLPVALPGLAAGWIIIFIQTAGEVTASAILSGSRTPVIGRVLMDLWSYGSIPQVAALAIIITLINTAAVLVVLRLSNRSINLATN